MSDLRTRVANATGSEPVSIGYDTDGNGNELFDHDAVRESGQAPDVDASGITADMDVSVFVAWSRVMAEVQSVGKGTSKGLNYAFRGIDAILNAVGPALRKHCVTVVPIKVAPTYEVITSKSGAVMNYCRGTVTFAVFGPRGDQLPVPVEAAGEAFDTGDKATTKMQSVALRTMYINALAIPVDAPERDTEYGVQHERGVPAPPTPPEYFREIIAESTTVPRLRQIREELNTHPAIGGAIFEVDGEDITLIKLVAKVGRERAAQTSGGQE